MRNRYAQIWLIGFCFLLTACQGSKKKQVIYMVERPVELGVARPLVGTRWQLIKLYGEDHVLFDVNPNVFTLELRDMPHRVIVQGAYNRYEGVYTCFDHANDWYLLSLSVRNQPRLSGSYDDLEKRYLKMLNSIQECCVVRDMLYLHTYKNGHYDQTVAIFKEVQSPAPAADTTACQEEGQPSPATLENTNLK